LQLLYFAVQYSLFCGSAVRGESDEMNAKMRVMSDNPFMRGEEAGRKVGQAGVRTATETILKHEWFRDTLGAMTRTALNRMVKDRMETPPDYKRFPELEDIYPERLDYLRGFARGAACPVSEAALYSFLKYHVELEWWYRIYQVEGVGDAPPRGGCSGILFVGPDGILGGQSVDSGVPPPPKGYRHRRAVSRTSMRHGPVRYSRQALVKPRTGYMMLSEYYNEKGVAHLCGASAGVFLDEPLEDTWPIMEFPFFRFAESVKHMAQLQRRYVLFSVGKGSNTIYADLTGNAMVVEKCNRRLGIRMIDGGGVLWCTEGYFESTAMYAYARAKRLEYVSRMGRHLGCGDMQYATDCAVRFAHIGELCHEPWGRGFEHMRRALTDHSTFPRAVCRHGGPDTDAYDTSVTLQGWIRDLTRGRQYTRDWIPWKKFCCEVPEKVTQYPVPKVN